MLFSSLRVGPGAGIHFMDNGSGFEAYGGESGTVKALIFPDSWRFYSVDGRLVEVHNMDISQVGRG
jgi:hypothetical protein